MNLTRRGFLKTTGLAVAAAAMKNPVAHAEPAVAAAAGALSIRDQFDLTREYIHLASFYIASHPKPVQEAIDKYRRALNENPFLVVERGMFEPGTENMTSRIKQAAAEYFEAKPQDFAVTQNTTTGLALVYSGLRIRADQEIVTTVHDHYSHHEAIRLTTEKSGATFRKIALFDSFDSIAADSIVDRIRKAITPKTRAVGVTWVHSSTGLKLPIAQIADAVGKANAGRTDADRILLVVDGVHGIGVENETVTSLGCDFLCAGTHKWIFAPRGTGIIWGKPEAWAQLRPTIPTFDDWDSYNSWIQEKPLPSPNRASFITPGGFQAYEHQWAMADAFQFHMKLGKKNVADQIHHLNTMCKDELAALPNVTLYTPRSPELSAGIVCFDVKGNKPDDVVKKLLDKKIIASTTPYALSYARLAPSLINNPEEIQTAIREIRAM